MIRTSLSDKEGICRIKRLNLMIRRHLFLHLSDKDYMYLIKMTFSMSILSVYLSIYISIYLFIYLSIYLSRIDLYEKMVGEDPAAPTLQEHMDRAVTKYRYSMGARSPSTGTVRGPGHKVQVK